MKMTKRILALVIVLILCVSFTGSAFASGLSKFRDKQSGGETAAFASTQSFLDAMDAEGIIYTYHGLDSDNDDYVEVVYTGDYCDSIDINIYFDESGTEANFRFWNVIDFNSVDYREILTVVNQLNSDYKWAKFVVDTSDYSVTASIDTLFPFGDAGEICLETLNQIVNIADLGYHALESYIK